MPHSAVVQSGPAQDVPVRIRLPLPCRRYRTVYCSDGTSLLRPVVWHGHTSSATIVNVQHGLVAKRRAARLFLRMEILSLRVPRVKLPVSWHLLHGNTLSVHALWRSHSDRVSGVERSSPRVAGGNSALRHSTLRNSALMNALGNAALGNAGLQIHVHISLVRRKLRVVVVALVVAGVVLAAVHAWH